MISITSPFPIEIALTVNLNVNYDTVTYDQTTKFAKWDIGELNVGRISYNWLALFNGIHN